MAWLDISQAAFELGTSERTIRNWIRTGKLQSRADDAGRVLVEIPEEGLNTDNEPTESASDDASSADDSDASPRSTRKRLELALLECGRIKGTLASQERIVESLTANVAELTAKLHRSTGRFWKTAAALAVAVCLGVVGFVAADAAYRYQASRETAAFADRLDNEKRNAAQEIERIRAALRKEMADLADRHKAELLAVQGQSFAVLSQKDAEYKANYEERAKNLEERYQADIRFAEELKKRAAEDHDRWEKETGDLRRANADLARERDRLAEQADRLSRDTETLAQLKKDYRTLETELVEYRRKLLELGGDAGAAGATKDEAPAARRSASE